MIGVLSDAHGNGPTFKLVCNYLFSIGVKDLVFLGDSVGYIPSLSVVDFLMSNQEVFSCIKGNHEEMLLTGDYPDASEDVYKMKNISAMLTSSQRNYLASWPQFLDRVYPSGKVTFIHGSPDNYLNGYVYPDSDLDGFDIDSEFIFMGHTHRPFVRKYSDKTYVNVGSSGLPRDDARYVSAALFDPNTGQVKIIRLDVTNLDLASYLGKNNVHPSVLKLLDRRADNIVGDIVAG
ncbi:MAG: metallophosphoesterase family protein [Halioglobus sp.]